MSQIGYPRVSKSIIVHKLYKKQFARNLHARPYLPIPLRQPQLYSLLRHDPHDPLHHLLNLHRQPNIALNGLPPLLHPQRRHRIIWQEDLAQSRKARKPFENPVRMVEPHFKQMRNSVARRPYRKRLDDEAGVRRQDGDEVVDGFDFDRKDVETVGQSCCFCSDLAAHLREGQERGEVARRHCRGEREAETAVWVH
jgi:hypothetical protein